MKPIIQKLWMVIAMLCLSIPTYAYDFEVDGIYYNVLSLEDLTCEVTYNPDNYTSEMLCFADKYGYSHYLQRSYPSYSGSIAIPSKIIYKGKELTITSIGQFAFLNCTGLVSLSLPSSINNIEEVFVEKYNSSTDCYAGAFDYCNIKTLTVGNAYELEMFNRSFAYHPFKNIKTIDYLTHLVLSSNFNGYIQTNFTNFPELISIKSEQNNAPAFSEGEHFSNKQYLRMDVLVPQMALSDYENAKEWCDFWYIDSIEEGHPSLEFNRFYDFENEGIYYNVLSRENLTCEVSHDDNPDNPKYKGKLTIPTSTRFKDKNLSVIGIGYNAFVNCRDLSFLELPTSITYVRPSAFDGTNIEYISVANSNSLEVLPYNLPNLILSVDYNGIIDKNFSGYKNLKSIISYSMEPSLFSGDEHFSNSQFMDLSVWVPENSLEAYQTADVWKNFWDLKPMKAVKTITLNETSISLEPNQTIQLLATVVPEDAFDATITWQSSNPDIATVDANGLVTAITKGDATITVSSMDGSKVSAQCTVHVDLLIKEITLSETETGLEPGESKKLTVTITPETAFVKDVIWESDAEDIAVVDQDGNVTAKNIGIANVSVHTTDGSNLTAICRITVSEHVKSIDVSPNEANIKEGETIQLICTIYPETATYKDVVWESEDNDVASVDANGLVSAISSGKTIIKAIASDGSNVYGECNITVTAETLEIDGIYYQRNSPSSLKIVANPDNPYSGNFFIPASVELNGKEMTITEIGVNAFAGCDELTRIVISSNVAKIDESSFTGCAKLEYVKICDGSALNVNLDKAFPDSPIDEIYVGSNDITYDTNSRLLGIIKGMTLGSSVTAFPPAQAFQSLENFIVKSSDHPMIEPEDYCSNSISLINKQTVNDSYTHIMYRFFYLVTYTHLSPILDAMKNGTLNFVNIDREIKGVEVDTSKTQETIPTTAGDRYQEFGYKDECNYSYQEIIAKSEFNRNPIENISFEKAILELEIGNSIYPTVIFNPEYASFKALVWSSSDDNVATVDMFGNVMKISSGEAEITATTTDGSNLSAKCKIVDIGAGIVNISSDERISITTLNGEILVSGNLGNYLTEVYDTRGQLITKTSDQVIELKTKGVYVVRIGTYTKKIIL